MRTRDIGTKLRSKFTLLFMTCAVLLAIPAVALADNLVNDISSVGDRTITAGGSTTIDYKVNGTGGDGQTGCNASDGSPATVTLDIPSGVTATGLLAGNTLKFTACNAFQGVTFSSNTAGNYPINVSSIADSGAGSYNNQANFTLVVNDNCPSGDNSGNLQDGKCAAPVTNTAPSVSVGGVDDGASYNKGSVPNATCDVTDAEDGNSSSAATLSDITGPYASDGIGSQTASCSYTDGGGLKATASETYSIVDPSAPVIGYTLNPATPDGSNGWYKSDVTLTWNVSEPQSPNSLQETGCVDQNITSDQAATTYSCSATSAGGSANEQSVTIKRDATAPVISPDGVKSGTLGSNGWYTTDVGFGFTASDGANGSGLAPADQAFTKTITTEGPAQNVSSGTVTDLAGNPAVAINSPNFKIDKSDPYDVTFHGGPNADGSYDYGTTAAAPTCTASDNVSGMPDDGGCKVTDSNPGGFSATGSHTLTATATDNAGRTETAERTYTVAPYRLSGFYQPVDMNGVFNSVKGGSTVPLKFELFQSISGTELTATSGITLQYVKVNCVSSAPYDAIEETVATGGTSLRYDSTGGQYIYNWKTPTGANTCYKVTMTAADGSTLTAYFKMLK